VTSALAASAQVNVSLTQRGLARSVTFVTPRVGKGECVNEWARAVLAADTAVIYMGIGEAGVIADTLIGLGVPPGRPVVVVENASLPEHREFSLSLGDLPRLADLTFKGPAIILIGEAYARAHAQPLAARPAVRCA
jgi:uroporphyrin-III C-methyltransferase